MPPPSPYTKRRSVAAPPPVSPRSKGGFFYKSILVTLFLLALPLFPSQAPDFVGETVLTKFWELIHLLFVGIAVAYGLFSRRSVESSVDSRMRSRVDESSLSYVSTFFPVSSVFDEDSFDFRSDESRLIHLSSRASVVVVNESQESESFNQVQAWNSQYYQGRSKVVARPAYGLDGHFVHQPLGLPVRSLMSGLRDNAPLEDSFVSDSSCDGAVSEKADKDFDEVVAAPPSPPVVPWHSRPEMMAMGDEYLSNFQPLSVDETHYAALESRSSHSTVSSSSSSSRTSFESQTQNRFSPSRSVSQDSLNSNVDEQVKEKSVECPSRSSSLSLPPSPPLVTDDTHRLVLHSRHYSDGSLLEDDVRQELEGSEVKGRRAEIFNKKELRSKSLKLTAESSRKWKNKSRRSYPPDPISSPITVADDSTTRRRDLQHKSDDHLPEDNIRKGLESDHKKLRVKKGLSHDSLELTAEASSLTVPAVDVLFQPKNPKASRRSSRGGRDTVPVKDIKGNSKDDFVDLDKSRKKDLPGDNKEVKSSSPRREPQSWRGSSKVSSRGKSVRTIRSDTIRSDRHGKHLKTDGVSSHDRTEPKAESHGRTKPRRQWKEELAIVLHQEKLPETHAKSEPEDDVTEETTVEQLQLTLEEEEEAAAAWESQSNASHDHYEVDRKADEFIAKFREQIRLQKLHSGEQPRGGGGIGIIRNSHLR